MDYLNFPIPEKELIDIERTPEYLNVRNYILEE